MSKQYIFDVMEVKSCNYIFLPYIMLDAILSAVILTNPSLVDLFSH